MTKSKVNIELIGEITDNNYKFLDKHMPGIVSRDGKKVVIRGDTETHELDICFRYLKQNSIPYDIIYWVTK